MSTRWAARRAKTDGFRHRSPPLPVQIALGVFVDGVLAPVLWMLERLGRDQRSLESFLKRRDRRIASRNPFRGYVPGPQDVFVATYMKSGTNWMMQIVYQLIHQGAGTFRHIHDVVPWPDTQAMARYMSYYAVPLQHADAWRDAPQPRRIIKTHFPWAMLPRSDQARYITVIRDPKDVFVSNYFFLRDGLLGPAMPTVNAWYELFRRGRLMGGSWAESAAGFWAERHRPNVMVVSFSSMKRDLPGTVRRVAEFLGIAVSEEVLASVGVQSAFSQMKRIDHRFRMARMIPWRESSAMLRKGVQGGSSELLSLEQRRALDAKFIKELRWLRSDLPYEEFAELA